MQDATLSRLKAMGKGEDTEGEFTKVDWVEADITYLSKNDCSYLSKYISLTYLSQKAMTEIRERFEEDSSVQLRQFLNEEWIEKINAAMSHEQENSPPKDYTVGICDSWKAVGPAHKQRFLEYTGQDEGTSIGAILLHLKKHMFQSESFGHFLKLISSLGLPSGHRGRVRRFRPGLDYTVAHYGILTTQAVLDATLCFAAGKGGQTFVNEETGELIASAEDTVWESGDVGGFECYIAANEEDDDAAAQYDDEDDTELLSVSVSNNTLSLVYRDPGTMKFVKYVGCQAPSSRFDVSMEYKVRGDEAEERDVNGDDLREEDLGSKQEA